MSTSPIVGGHFAIWDNPGDPCYDIHKIPPHWHHVRFDAVDHLCITPSVVVPKPEHSPLDDEHKSKSFPMFGHFEDATPDNRLGSRKERFEWVVEQARTQNPEIKISVTQFVIANMDQELYANSVIDLLAEFWNKTTEGGISLRIDGYDVDYEDTHAGSSNLASYAANILYIIRKKIDEWNTSHRHDARLIMKPIFLSITPASNDYLDANGSDPPIDLAEIIDYVNMQNYDGGLTHLADHYINAIPNLRPSQILVGVNSEDPSKNDRIFESSFSTAVKYYQAGYENEGYAGLWNWKLNSDDWIFQNYTQRAIFNRVHNIEDAAPPENWTSLEKLVEDGFTKNGTELAHTYTKEHWLTTKGFRGN